MILRAKNITSGYEGVQILWGVDLDIPRGQTVVLLGPNGAGKTTLLRTLVGLLPAWSGHIEFDDNDITLLPTEKRVRSGLAFMSELGVFPDLSVLDNLRMGGYFLSRSGTADRISKMYALFPDLARLRRSLGGSLSGGQRKMLGVAKALMSQPRLLVMDEPSAGLSPKYVKEVIDILKVAHGEGLSLLIAEQNVLFLELADQGYVLEGGRMLAHGSADELKSSDVVRRAYFGMVEEKRA
ncbi:MAG: ABC transporter ATP-binding protein [Rhodanobacter sp.]|nr:MAG: ABC transporter ATP-binding protein [Rhodanobacter sp.]